MENFNIEEKIGDYIIIKDNSVIIYDNKDVDVELIEDDNPVVFRFQFINRGNRNSSIEQELIKNALIFKFIDFNREYSLGGIFEPIDVAKLESGETLYLSCVVYTLNAQKGNRVLKYSFLIKK